MNDQLIIRRRWRSFVVQLTGGIVTALIAVVVTVLSTDGSEWVVAIEFVSGLLLLAAAIQGWELNNAPHTLVANNEFLGLLGPRKTRQYIRWEKIRSATHSTELRGMRWSFDTTEGIVSFADPGINPNRWGALWSFIADEVTEHGEEVNVDLISNTLYSRGNN